MTSSFTILTLACLTKPQALTAIFPMIYLGISQRHEFIFKQKDLVSITILSLMSISICVAYYTWIIYIGNNFPPYHIAGRGKFIWDNSLSAWLSDWYYLPSIFSQLQSWLWGWVVLGLVLVALPIPTLVKLKIKNPWFFHVWALGFVVDYIVEAEHLSRDTYNMSVANPIAAALSGLALVIICRHFVHIYWGPNFRKTIYALILAAVAIQGQIELRALFGNSYLQYYILGNKLALISKDSDLVVSFGMVPVAIYYSGLHGWLFPPAEVWTHSTGGSDRYWIDSPERVNLLKSLRERGANWLVVPFWEYHPESEPILADYIRSAYELVYDTAAGKIYRAR
jgi:hypothetical protein